LLNDIPTPIPPWRMGTSGVICPIFNCGKFKEIPHFK
jgi:hypothetical protein